MKIRQSLTSILSNHSAGFLASGLIWGAASAICCPCPFCIAGSASCIAKGTIDGAKKILQ